MKKLLLFIFMLFMISANSQMVVTTVAGSGNQQTTDGIGKSASFNAPNGIAENFNHFIKHSGSNYLLFTKEPYLNVLYTIAQIDKTITEQKVIEKEVFDEKNVHSLAGSLPNHLILLLDVSVSMKKSGLIV